MGYFTGTLEIEMERAGEPFAGPEHGGRRSAGLDWPNGMRELFHGSEADIQSFAKDMAAAWLSVAAASEDRVAESEARAIRYRESAGRIRAERQAAADDRIMARDLAAERAS